VRGSELESDADVPSYCFYFFQKHQRSPHFHPSSPPRHVHLLQCRRYPSTWSNLRRSPTIHRSREERRMSVRLFRFPSLSKSELTRFSSFYLSVWPEEEQAGIESKQNAFGWSFPCPPDSPLVVQGGVPFLPDEDGESFVTLSRRVFKTLADFSSFLFSDDRLGAEAVHLVPRSSDRSLPASRVPSDARDFHLRSTQRSSADPSLHPIYRSSHSTISFI